MSSGPHGKHMLRSSLEASTLDAHEKRASQTHHLVYNKKWERLVWSSFAVIVPRRNTFRHFVNNLTDAQLEANDGSGATAIAKSIWTSLERTSIQGATCLLHISFNLKRCQDILASRWSSEPVVGKSATPCISRVVTSAETSCTTPFEAF